MKTKLTILSLTIIFFSGFIACQKNKKDTNTSENLSIDQLMSKTFTTTNPPELNFENDEDRTFTNGKTILLIQEQALSLLIIREQVLSFEKDKEVSLLNVQGEGYLKLLQTNDHEISIRSNTNSEDLVGILIRSQGGGIRLKEIPNTTILRNLYLQTGQTILVDKINYQTKGNAFIVFKEVK
jgi:hypothetical protein